MKKFLQKSCHWLVMLIAWFAVSATAWAQDATFDFSDGMPSPKTDGDVRAEYTMAYTGYGVNIWQSWKLTITCEVAEIEEIQFDNGVGNIKADCGEYDTDSHKWTGSSNSVTFSVASSGVDTYIKTAAVKLVASDPNDPSIKSTLNFDRSAWNLTIDGSSAVPTSGCHFDTRDVFVNADGVTMTLQNIESRGEGGLNSERKGEGYAQNWPNECYYSQHINGYFAMYFCNGEGFTINAPEGYNITKIEVNRPSNNTQYSLTSLIIDGVQNTDAAKGTWEGEAASVAFSTISGDATKRILVSNIKVTLVPAAAEDTNYTLEFVDAPEGAAVTIDGTTYEENASWTVAKYLNLGSITNVVEPDGYYAEKEYDATDHKFTVTYKHWITYNVSVTGHMMGALEYNGNYYSADGTSSFQSKTVINDEEFKAHKLNGYDGAVSVTQESDYVYNVSVTYTESAPITYYVVFNTVPEGAYAWINGVKYEANGTFQTNLELSYSSLQEVNCPEGYYDNNYYSADDHTFYINYIEYEKFYVVVEGTEDANAGVKYDYKSYHNGDVLYTDNSFYLINYFDYYVTAIEVSGYNAEVSLVDHTITVTYTEKPVQGAPWEVNVASIFNDCTVIDNNGDGTKWLNNGSDIYYPYNSSNAADDYFVLTPVRLEAGKTYTTAISVHNAGTYPEKIEVLYGTGKSVSDLTNTAIPVEEITWNNYKDITGNVSVETSGVYYFALHAVSNADMNQLYAKTFSIKEFNPNSVGVASTYFQTGEVLTIEKSLAFELEAMPSATHSWYDGATDIPAGVELKDDQNNTYTITQFNYWDDDTQMSVALENEITAPGHYTLTIPAGTIPCVGNRFNKEIVFEWTILDPYVGHFAMSEAGWATLCVDYAYTLPTGYKAYAVGKVENGIAVLQEDGALVLSELLDGVAAGTPVIIEGPQAADVALIRPAYTPAAPEVNYLMGNPYANAYDYYAASIADQGLGSYDYWNDVWSYGSFGPCQLYQLASEEGKVGFYRQVEDGSTLQCAAHKAFLVVPDPAAESNARFLLPGQDVITGIDGVIATEAAENIFNLQGQRVIAPAKGGVYVKNGKKIIVK